MIKRMNRLVRLPVGRVLKREGFDLLNPSAYVVSLDEFERLKRVNDEDVLGLTYEEFCGIEAEGWSDMLAGLLHKDFELLDVVPLGEGERRMAEVRELAEAFACCV